MGKEDIDFKALDIREKQRWWAKCLANTMLLAEELNGVNENLKYTFYDIDDIIDDLSTEETDMLNQAYAKRLDAIAKETLKEGSPSYVMKFLEKTHDDYKQKKSGNAGITGLLLRAGNIQEAAFLTGNTDDVEIIDEEDDDS